MVDISIILTTFNREKSLEMTLASIENQTYKNFEVNILDDFSNDGTHQFCKDYIFSTDIPCRYIRVEKEGYNLALLRNCGVEFSKGKKIVFIDDDIIVTPEFIEQYNIHFKKDPDKIYLGKLLYVKSEELQKITLDDIKQANFDLLNKSLFSEFDPRRDTLKDLPDYYKVWGGNLGIKKEIFCLINGYDEDFDSWGGLDSDLGLRLIRSGYKIELLDDCVGYHMGTDFKPLCEIKKQAGVRLFEDVKINDLNPVRNKNFKKRKPFPIKIIYNGSKFKTNLTGENHE